MNNRKQYQIDDVFINIAQNYSKLSKCVSHQVGAVIVDVKGRIVASGCNGSPSGLQNCCDKFKNYNRKTDRAEHHKWSLVNEIHAETNAIAHSNRDDLIGATMYCTLQPCAQCSVIISGTGIKRIVFDNFYDKSNKRSAEIFKQAKIEMVQHGGVTTIIPESIEHTNTCCSTI